MRFLKPREFCRIVGISYSTFVKWVRRGRIRVVRLPSGRIRVPMSEVARLGRVEGVVRAVIYARVGSLDRVDELGREVQHLRRYCEARGYRVVDVLTDVGSSLGSRRGFERLLDYVASGAVDVVVVAYRDRLARFGFEHLEQLFNRLGVRIETVLGTESRDTKEMMEDLLAAAASIASKIYRGDPKRRKAALKKLKNAIESALSQ